MSADFSIVTAENRHLDALEALEKQCFSVPWSRNMLAGQISAPDGVFLVAETARDGAIGYIGCRTVLDEGYITNIAVNPDFRRFGIGDKLLKALIKLALERDLSFLTLEVRESNFPAISLYKKHNFKPVGFRENYYDKPKESAVLMTLVL